MEHRKKMEHKSDTVMIWIENNMGYNEGIYKIENYNTGLIIVVSRKRTDNGPGKENNMGLNTEIGMDFE